MSVKPEYDEAMKERETVLMTAEQKRTLEAAARKLRVSKGHIMRHATFEYLRKVEVKGGPLK